MQDFERFVWRRGTNSLKWDTGLALQADVLPLWVADMDFEAPPVVLEALRGRLGHGVLGYTVCDRGFCEEAAGWQEKRHGWNPGAESVVAVPGVVPGVHAAIECLCPQDKAVLVQTPVYPPLLEVPGLRGRRLVTQTLTRGADGRYRFDAAAFEALLDGVGAFLLCSPHNPLRRFWSREELAGLFDACIRRGVALISDEIHADFALPHEGAAAAFVPALPLWVERGGDPARAIVLNAASKTFNIAGLCCAAAFVPDLGLRTAYRRAVRALGMGDVNTLGYVASRTAWAGGADWLDALLDYLTGNEVWLRDTLEESLPLLQWTPGEGTFLAWLDFSGLGLPHAEVKKRLEQDARLWLSDGRAFGEGGEGFFRLNYGCPRSTLEQAVGRLCRTFAKAGGS